MIAKVSKKTQSIISKVFLVLMLFSYTLQPVQKEVNNFLHGVIHLFEKPDMILNHSKKTDLISVHSSKVHKSIEKNHNHTGLKYFSEIFKKSINKGEPANYPFTILKINKYLFKKTTRSLSKKIVFFSTDKTKSEFVENKLSKGYDFIFKEPPKYKIKNHRQNLVLI